MSEHDPFLLFEVALVLFCVFFGGITIFSGIYLIERDNLYSDLKYEVSAVEAEIHSPAVIKPVNTLTELKQLSTQYNVPIYCYEYRFYVIPDTYIGYVWEPEYHVSLSGSATVTNR